MMALYLPPIILRDASTGQLKTAAIGLLRFRSENCGCESFDPVLVADVHRIWFGLVQVFGWLALLGFLREDADTVFREILDEPGMGNIKAVLCITICPAMPGKTPRLAVMWGFEL